jgi:hypothetical protein
MLLYLCLLQAQGDRDAAHEAVVESLRREVLAKGHELARANERLHEALSAHRRGLLEKRGHSVSHAWRLRMFVLAGPAMVYTKRDGDMKPKGLIALTPSTEVVDVDTAAAPAAVGSDLEFMVRPCAAGVWRSHVQV